jgi:hypothetical protein
LAAIGDNLDAIRAAYLNSAVTIDYSQPGMTDAYLLGYYPHYVVMAAEVLSSLPAVAYAPVSASGLQVATIGSGPLPEAIGLIEAVAAAGLTTGRINIHSFDIHAAPWQNAIDATKSYAQLFSPGLVLQTRSVARDFALELQTEDIAVFSTSDIIMMQNCINEVASAASFDENIRLITHRMRSSSYLVIADLTGYPITDAAAARVEKALISTGEMLPLHRFANDARILDSPFARKVPPRTFFNFFGKSRSEAGEWSEKRNPKRWVNYSLSVWQKAAPI